MGFARLAKFVDSLFPPCPRCGARFGESVTNFAGNIYCTSWHCMAENFRECAEFNAAKKRQKIEDEKAADEGRIRRIVRDELLKMKPDAQGERRTE